MTTLRDHLWRILCKAINNNPYAMPVAAVVGVITLFAAIFGIITTLQTLIQKLFSFNEQLLSAGILPRITNQPAAFWVIFEIYGTPLLIIIICFLSILCRDIARELRKPMSAQINVQ